RGETRGRVKARPAQPIDRTVAADQSCRFAVPDHRIVFDAKCHCCSLAQTSLLLASVYSKIERKDTLVIGWPLQRLSMPQCARTSVRNAEMRYDHDWSAIMDGTQCRRINSSTPFSTRKLRSTSTFCCEAQRDGASRPLGKIRPTFRTRRSKFRLSAAER